MPLALRDLRVGYVPYRDDFSPPGDRRRFWRFATRRNIRFEIARPTEPYDVVVLSERADLSVWRRYRIGQAKIVYDLIDSYLAVPRTDLKGLFRGTAKFLSRQSRYFQPSYWRAVEDMCRRADAVVCTTEEQRLAIGRFCDNVHIVLDVQDDDVRATKTNYSANPVFSFVWEGLPTNLPSLLPLRPVLQRLASKRDILLHLVTDLTYAAYLGRYGNRASATLARRVFDNVVLHPWSANTLSTVATSCDMALIPISMKDPFTYGKPENKLLLFWRLGLPVVASATPAYVRAMERCGVAMACQSEKDWQATLELYMNNESLRREAGQSGREFAHRNYSEDKVLARWDQVFSSLFE